MRKDLFKLTGVIVGTIALLSFQNCSRMQLKSIDETIKAQKLSTTQVFADSNEDDRDTEPPQSDDEFVNISYLCSDHLSLISSNYGVSTGEVYALKMNSTEQVVCLFEASAIKQQILTQKKVSLKTIQSAVQAAGCQSLADGQYKLSGYVGSKLASNYVPGSLGAFRQAIISGLSGLTSNQSGIFTVAMSSTNSQLSFNTNNEPAKEQFQSVLSPVNTRSSNQSAIKALIDFNQQTHVTSLKCDQSASPLVVHLNSDVEAAEPLVLTAQAEGVNFDILGLNSDPAAHSPMRISWHRSRQYYFIALPDASGQVRGIDQLFGDNTLGPDDRFAADGFHALAKFDGRSADGKIQIAEADGLITSEDAIFSKLRMWQDANFDGVAQKNELLKLSDLGVTVIDLRYDANYKEVDRYGNQTKFKSVIKTADGRYHLLFDVWFNYQNLNF